MQVMKDGLSAVHVPYAYGFAIILLTVVVKAATLPLTKQQVDGLNLTRIRPMSIPYCISMKIEFITVLLVCLFLGRIDSGDAESAATAQGDSEEI